MAAPSSSAAHREEQFSLSLFVLTVVLSLAGLAGLLKLAAPDHIWAAQFAATPWHFVAAFLAVHLFTCFVEWVFHRYVLHKPVVPFLSRFYRQHTLHHSLTRIGRRHTPGGREVPFVENIYPVTEPEQGEASFFPWYTLPVFGVAVTPLFALLQWLAPAFPWFLAGYGALAFAVSLYEIFHAIEHWSFERWAPLIEHRRFGWFWRKVYSFHLRHHAVIDCNEAISGFFTLPVFDWLFGTFVLPKTLYLDGSEWTAQEFTSPRPHGFVRWCDRHADALVKSRRARAPVEVAAPGTYSRGERIAHYLTHGTGLAASVVALVVLVAIAAMRGEWYHVVSAILFGLALVGVYAAFANFSPARATHWRQVFRQHNHAAVFLLIGGTATPFLLAGVGGAWGWSLFAVVWTLCAVGAATRFIGNGRLKIVSRLAYVLLAIAALVALKPMVATIPQGALWLLLAGALCYGAGTVFHLWQRISYHQVVRHAFALGGTTCHLLAVVLFVLPGRI